MANLEMVAATTHDLLRSLEADVFGFDALPIALNFELHHLRAPILTIDNLDDASEENCFGYFVGTLWRFAYTGMNSFGADRDYYEQKN